MKHADLQGFDLPPNSSPAGGDDDFSLLDSIIASNMKLAGAKKAQAQGRKLTPEQAEAIAANEAAAQAAQWELTASFLHVCTETCLFCGAQHKRLLGWYQLSQRRGQDAQRLSKCEGPAPGAPVHMFKSREIISECAECYGGKAWGELPFASARDFPILASLKGGGE